MTEADKLRERLEPHVKKLEEINEKQGIAFYGFARTLLTIAAGLIAVLVSLKGNAPQPEFRRILFTITIGTLSIGIVFGSILLYTEIIAYNRLQTSMKAEILEILKDDKKNMLLADGSPGRWYHIGKWGMVISFLVALICLTVYSYG